MQVIGMAGSNRQEMLSQFRPYANAEICGRVMGSLRQAIGMRAGSWKPSALVMAMATGSPAVLDDLVPESPAAEQVGPAVPVAHVEPAVVPAETSPESAETSSSGRVFADDLSPLAVAVEEASSLGDDALYSAIFGPHESTLGRDVAAAEQFGDALYASIYGKKEA